MKEYRPSGFTLIEVVIVVAIISIVASIAIPKIYSAKRKANQMTTRANLKTIHTGQTMYYEENDLVYSSDLATLYSFIRPNSKQAKFIDQKLSLAGATNALSGYYIVALTSDADLPPVAYAGKDGEGRYAFVA